MVFKLIRKLIPVLLSFCLLYSFTIYPMKTVKGDDPVVPHVNSSLADSSQEYIDTVDTSGERTQPISRVTIHCMAGHNTALGCNKFLASRQRASTNYSIGSDGGIGVGVEEWKGAYTSSNQTNDTVAVTIEVSSDSDANAKMDDAAYASLILLVADICDRHSIDPTFIDALENGTKSYGSVDTNAQVGVTIGTITLHCFWANKSCPGNWFYSKLTSGEFIAAVKKEMKNPASTGKKNQNTSSDTQPGNNESSDIDANQSDYLANSQVKLDTNIDLSEQEQLNANIIKNAISIDMHTWDWGDFLVTAFGLITIIYAVILLLAACFDKVNNVFPVELIPIVSFKNWKLVDTDIYAENNGHTINGLTYITLVGIITRCLALLICGLLIVSGTMIMTVNTLSDYLLNILHNI